MPLIKETGVVADPWRFVADDEALPATGAIAVTLARWQAERASLQARPTPLGLRLKSDQTPAAIADDLDRLDLIALEFPKFTDGRAYSTARLLRERCGYRGELRAVGQVLRDQLRFMQRCGFDSFEVPATADVGAWLSSLGQFTVTYQPAADGRRPVLLRRHDDEDEERPAPSPISVTVDEGEGWSRVCAGVWAY